jgi:hypothetical protein
VAALPPDVVHVPFPVVELEDLRARGFEERSVVRHEQQRHVRLEDRFGHPADKLHVHVVRRLIQDEHVRGANQRGGDRDLAPLAPGHRLDAHRRVVDADRPQRACTRDTGSLALQLGLKSAQPY